MIYLRCPCGQKYRARQAQIGKRFSCLKCGARLMVPVEPSPSTSGQFVGAVLAPHAIAPPFAWRDGECMVVGPDAVLPPHCVKCDKPTDRVRERTFNFAPRDSLLRTINVVLGLAALVGARLPLIPDCVTLRFAECHQCGRWRRAFSGINLGFASLAIACATVVISVSIAGYWHNAHLQVLFVIMTGAGFALLFLAAVEGIAEPLRLVEVKRVRWYQDPGEPPEDVLWLSGANPRFLERLETWDSGWETVSQR